MKKHGHKYFAIDSVSFKYCKICGKLKEPREYGDPNILYYENTKQGMVVYYNPKNLTIVREMLFGFSVSPKLSKIFIGIYKLTISLEKLPPSVREQIWRRFMADTGWHPSFVNQKLIPITRKGYLEYIGKRNEK